MLQVNSIIWVFIIYYSNLILIPRLQHLILNPIFKGIQINEESAKEFALTKKHQRVTVMTNARVLAENVAMVIAVMTNTLMKSKTSTA